MRKFILPGLAVAALAAAGAPALAQSVESLTVTGQWNGRGEPPATLSRVVDYSDLDLRLAADQSELRHRIDVTARDVCDELGQDRPNKANLGHSCQEEAVRNAMDQVKVAVAQAFANPPVAVAVTGVGADTAYVAPAVPDESTTSISSDTATSADTAAAPASYTTSTVTNGPVPDTPANRAKYGQPMSRAGKQTTPAGN